MVYEKFQSFNNKTKYEKIISKKIERFKKIFIFFFLASSVSNSNQKKKAH